jgi:hypothetical protein
MSAKSITAKPSAIGKFPDFITKDDLAEAVELETEIVRLVEHRESFSRAPLLKKFDDARDNYLAAATEENYATLKARATELTLNESESYNRARGFVHDVIRDRFIGARFLPWARAIVERGLTKARASLADVVASEEAHHRELIGEPLGQQPNAIIEKARRPVRELEGVLSSINAEKVLANEHLILTFLKFLREHAGKSMPADFGEGSNRRVDGV